MSDNKFSLENVKKFSENTASRNRWRVNPDSDFRESVEEGLFENYKQYGYLVCPCREAWGSREKDRDIICPCEYCADDIIEFGHCYCALYMSEAFIASGEEPGSIPERRDQKLMPD
ncbi:MAG: ferredoxin:thioredoxin reductase [Spirochaetales bacterium]|nr:ferredoxin:thioredoxin reductase [Spirochaetales bacterium]